MGEIIMVIASTRPRLAILEPTTLPKAKSGCPPSADWILTINSGAEVAKDTTVIPMTIFGIEKRKERATAERMSQSPPLIKINIPTATAKKAMQSICANILLSN